MDTLINQYELAKKIDHTLLRPDAMERDIINLCEEALMYDFMAVCVAPVWVQLAVEKLKESSVKVVSVVGFPHGNTLAEVKAFEASNIVSIGANEIDMVINIGALLSGKHDIVFNDIRCVVEAAKKENPDTLIKIILETALLPNELKIKGCKIAEEAGADFIKTSTGFSLRGATVEDVILFKNIIGGRLGIKAAGGIRDLRTALAMLEAGATRLGCSSSVNIMMELLKKLEGKAL